MAEPSISAPARDLPVDGAQPIDGDHPVEHDALVEDDLLVEDVSIDGMCGVY